MIRHATQRGVGSRSSGISLPGQARVPPRTPSTFLVPHPVLPVAGPWTRRRAGTPQGEPSWEIPSATRVPSGRSLAQATRVPTRAIRPSPFRPPSCPVDASAHACRLCHRPRAAAASQASPGGKAGHPRVVPRQAPQDRREPRHRLAARAPARRRHEMPPRRICAGAAFVHTTSADFPERACTCARCRNGSHVAPAFSQTMTCPLRS